VSGGLGCREAASGVSLREFFVDGYVDWWFIASPQAVVVVFWFWVKNQEWGRDRLYVLLPFVFLCVGWCAWVRGAAKPQAVSRCARFFCWV